VSEARAAVLGAIRSALGPGTPTAGDVPRAYALAGTRGAAGDAAAVERFCERAAEYQATVRRVRAGELEAAVAATCRERGARRVAVTAQAPATPEGVERIGDDPPLRPADLDTVDGTLSGCALAIAETGTIVLDSGPRSGRRALTLVPDWHLCVVQAADVVPAVPDAVAALAGSVAQGRPLTFIAGPSATSDIELERVEGVHGPRTLVILVVAP
jgi:L-lactate dehydrogenase complex protein LldG